MHVYDEKTGDRVTAGGNPVKRPPGTFAPCRYKQKGCPKGTPENQRTLTEKNWLAFTHYLECRAVGQWPVDPIVARNAATIRSAIDSAERTQMMQQIGPLASLMRVGGLR